MPERKGLGPSDNFRPLVGEAYPSVRISFGGEPDEETLAKLKRHEEILRNVGNFRNDPWKATKEFFRLSPFNVITEPSQAMLPTDPGVETEFGPRVLQEQIEEYFRGKKR